MDWSATGKFRRLKNALNREYNALDKLREQRSRLLSLGAGPKYPHRANEAGWLSEVDDILPIMRQAAQATAISLSANSPRIRVNPYRVARTAFARTYEDALNYYCRTMHLEEEGQACAINGFYGLGIMKVYMANSVPIWLEESEWMDPGKPYAQSLSLHHFVYDTGATQFRHCQFLADRYRVAFEDVVNDSRFSTKLRKQLRDIGPTDPNDMHGEEPWRRVSYDDCDLRPLLFLSDVFLPDEGKIYTYVVDREFNILIDEPLAEVDWDGQETGPYHFLNLGPVPDKTTPSSPAQNLESMANMANSLYRQLERQSMMQRSLAQVPRDTPDEDINAAKAARDWSILRTDAQINVTRLGGADQNNFAFFLNVLDQINKYGGNIDLRLGLGQVADTATQEGIMSQGVSRAEGNESEIFAKFMRGVVKEIGRLLYSSKTVGFNGVRNIAPGISIYAPWQPAIEEGSRMGPFEDYDLDIEIDSMAYKSPAQRVMELDQTFERLVPLAPLTMQQGQMPDVNYYLQERARLLNNSCLENLLMNVAPPPEQAGGGSHERTMATNGQREYIHRSAGGGGGQAPGQQQLAMMSAASADNAA